MVGRVSIAGFCAALLLIGSPASVRASFHLMQVHKVIAGVNGFSGVQAIQLRMRGAGQDSVNLARLRVWDAAGQNPILIADPETVVPNGAAAAKVLIASSNFATFTSPPAVPDFILDNLIPDSYLAAGSLTWESDAGNVYWRLSWGGAAYTGDTTGSLFNDDDGDYGPAYAGPLPSGNLQCLRFNLNYFDESTTNAANYGLQPGAATFSNNADVQFTVIAPPTSVEPLPLESWNGVIASPNPFRAITRVAFQLAAPTQVRFTVSDVSGRRVADASATLPAGARAFEWAGTDLHGRPAAAGVYFYRLQAAGQEQTGRLVLVR